MKRDFATIFPSAEPARQQLIGWWQTRSGREQLLLATLAALALLWLLFVAVLRPFQTMRADAKADIRTYSTLNTRLRQGGPMGGGAPAQRSGGPAAVLSTSATEFGLAASVSADGSNFRVLIENASYDSVIRWIAELERTSTLRVTTMRLDRRPASGLVAADIMLRA